MVSARRQQTRQEKGSKGRDGNGKPDDIEHNRASANKKRYKDAPGGHGEDDIRREELKQKLQEGVDDMDLEKFRKSDDEVRGRPKEA